MVFLCWVWVVGVVWVFVGGFWDGGCVSFGFLVGFWVWVYGLGRVWFGILFWIVVCVLILFVGFAWVCCGGLFCGLVLWFSFVVVVLYGFCVVGCVLFVMCWLLIGLVLF